MLPWLTIVSGGLVSVLITIGFNMYWDQKKQRLLEDWEFRRYHANQIQLATAGLMDAFFATKAELYFLTYTLETLAETLTQLTSQAEEIVRQQAGREPGAAELEQRKAQWLLPFETFNREQVTLRWNQHEQKVKETQAQAEAHLSALQPLIPAPVVERLLALYAKLNTRWSWGLQGAEEQSKLFENALPELARLRAELMKQIEIKLGKRRAADR
jgi:hypothetical protein